MEDSAPSNTKTTLSKPPGLPENIWQQVSGVAARFDELFKDETDPNWWAHVDVEKLDMQHGSHNILWRVIEDYLELGYTADSVFRKLGISPEETNTSTFVEWHGTMISTLDHTLSKWASYHPNDVNCAYLHCTWLAYLQKRRLHAAIENKLSRW